MFRQTGPIFPRLRHCRQRIVTKKREDSHLIQLLVLLISMMTTANVQVARSYVVVPNPPVILPTHSYTVTTPVQPKRIRYNLGSSDGETADDVAKATQYWVEYESVNEYPSPLQIIPQKSEMKASVGHDTTRNDVTAKQKIQHPALIPHRLTGDEVLKIVSHSPNEGRTSSFNKNDNTNVVKAFAQPTMRSGQEFDINTAWIELLIHEQQMKLASNMATNTNFNAAIAG